MSHFTFALPSRHFESVHTAAGNFQTCLQISRQRQRRLAGAFSNVPRLSLPYPSEFEFKGIFHTRLSLEERIIDPQSPPHAIAHSLGTLFF